MSAYGRGMDEPLTSCDGVDGRLETAEGARGGGSSLLGAVGRVDTAGRSTAIASPLTPFSVTTAFGAGLLVSGLIRLTTSGLGILVKCRGKYNIT